MNEEWKLSRPYAKRLYYTVKERLIKHKDVENDLALCTSRRVFDKKEQSAAFKAWSEGLLWFCRKPADHEDETSRFFR